jgi:hypothetical protein
MFLKDILKNGQQDDDKPRIEMAALEGTESIEYPT